MNNTLPSLWSHQKHGVIASKIHDRFLYAFEMGTGKTRTVLEALRHKVRELGRLPQTLVVCPLIVVPNWKIEVEKYAPELADQVVLLKGSSTERTKTVQKVAFKNGRITSCIFVTNFESLLSDRLLDLLHIWGPQVLIVDELHRCKSGSAKRTKAVTAFADKAKWVYGLTGTPILNSQLDLFSQFRILRPEVFGENFFAFRAKFFEDKNAYMPKTRYFPNWQPRRGADLELRALISPYMLTAKKSDCLDLPPLVKKTIEVSLGKEQQKAYDELEKDFITFINDEACTAQLAITKALRLQQVVAGHVPLGEGDDVTIHRFPENPRLGALADLLEEITAHSRAIVWTHFVATYPDIKGVCEKLGLPYVEVHGGISAADKAKAVERFQTDPSVRVFIGNPSSGGIGINLTEASYMIYYSRSFSLEADIQSEARNYRAGSEQHEKITRIDLVSPGSIDELVVRALESKAELGLQLLRNHFTAQS